MIWFFVYLFLNEFYLCNGKFRFLHLTGFWHQVPLSASRWDTSDHTGEAAVWMEKLQKRSRAALKPPCNENLSLGTLEPLFANPFSSTGFGHLCLRKTLLGGNTPRTPPKVQIICISPLVLCLLIPTHLFPSILAPELFWCGYFPSVQPVWCWFLDQHKSGPSFTAAWKLLSFFISLQKYQAGPLCPAPFLALSGCALLPGAAFLSLGALEGSLCLEHPPL